MSDLFHEDVPDIFITRVWDVMAQLPETNFLILTKRAERMRDWVNHHEALKEDYAWRCEHHEREGMRTSPAASVARERARPLPNVWLGVSIENRRFVQRADLLRDTPAAVRFISAEPLLGPLRFDFFRPERPDWDGPHPSKRMWTDPYEGPELSLERIDWLIVGGESGPGHRPIEAQWVRDLLSAAECMQTAFFFKQWGGQTPKAGGRLLDGRTWDELPVADGTRKHS